MGAGNKYPQQINAEIDLHGHTISEALDAMINFLDDSEEKGYQYLRIITGKGLHSRVGAPTIRDTVKTWLHDNGYEYRPAKPSHGGDGALIVVLF